MPEELQQSHPAVLHQPRRQSPRDHAREKPTLEQLLYGSGPRNLLSDRLPPAGTLVHRLAMGLAGLVPVVIFALTPLSNEFDYGSLLSLPCLLLCALIPAAAWRFNYLLASRIEDLERRIWQFDIVLLLMSEESLLVSEPQYGIITRRPEYRGFDLRRPRGRAALAGRELAYLLGVTKRPSPSLLWQSGWTLTLGLWLLAMLYYVAASASLVDVWMMRLLMLQLCALMAMHLVLSLCLALCGGSVLRAYIRGIDRQDSRSRRG